jgi:hypothetical protein
MLNVDNGGPLRPLSLQFGGRSSSTRRGVRFLEGAFGGQIARSCTRSTVPEFGKLLSLCVVVVNCCIYGPLGALRVPIVITAVFSIACKSITKEWDDKTPTLPRGLARTRKVL